MAEALLKNTFVKISPAYELVADVIVGTATTQVDFSGLNFGKEDELLLVGDLVGNNAVVSLYANANYTATNYYRQSLAVDSTTVSTARNNNSIFMAGTSGIKELVLTKIKLTNNGYFVVQSERNVAYGGSSLSLGSIFITSTFTATSITSLRLGASATNGIAVGSRFQLYKLVAKKVADITISTATTQVDITGLNIDKDSEYMLVSNFKSPTSNPYIFFNNNTTPTNYYTQRLEANHTSPSANRYNTPYLGVVDVDQFALINTHIKLTNNGYVVYQTNENRSFDTATMSMQIIYGTSTFTATSITEISINAGTNGIAIGSRFQLYKLK